MKNKQKNKETGQRAEGKKKHVIALSLLAVSTVLAYSNALSGTWALDDVVASRPVDIHDFRDLLGFRKITYLTFLLNQFIAPFDPASFRFFNIMIHFTNSVLVYVLTLRMALAVSGSSGMDGSYIQRERDVHATREKAYFAAVVSSFIFALHPLNINAVSYIVQRMASLATFFVLLSLLSYIAARRSQRALKAALLYALSGIFVAAGIFSKENAVMAIPLLILYDHAFLSGSDMRGSLKKRAVIVLIGVVSLGLASYFLQFHSRFIELAGIFLSPDTRIQSRDWMAIDVYWTPLQHVLTEFRVVARYLFLTVIPLPRFLVFDWWGFPVSTGIATPATTLLSMLLILSLVSFSVLAMRRYPLLCFGVLWYVIAISLESFFAPGTDLYFEHRNYLPLSGFIPGVVGQSVMSLRGGNTSTRSAWGTAICVFAVLGILTFTRNFVWKDSIVLWGDTLHKTPSNIRAMMALGNSYLKTADTGMAEKFFGKAMKASSTGGRLYFLNESAYNLGMVYLQKRELKKARELINDFASSIESYKSRILEGFYKSLNDDTDGAIRDYLGLLKETRGIDRVMVLTLLGDAYREKRWWNMAMENYRKAISIDPGFSAAYYGTGAAYMGKKDLNNARRYISMTLSLDPFHILALSDMADLLLMEAKPDEALRYAENATRTSPPFYQPYLSMANVLTVRGDQEKAEYFFNRALELGMKEYMVPFSKARAYYLRGDREKTERYLSELKGYKDLPANIREIIR